MVDLIISLSIICSIIGTYSKVTIDTVKEKETLVGSLALLKKLSAIRTKQPSHFVISDGRLFRYETLPFDDCAITFSVAGTASKAGTCEGESHSLTLRPGEGGMGYPW